MFIKYLDYVHTTFSCFLRFHDAFELCRSSGSEKDFETMGKACLIHMEIEQAIQIYRMGRNVGMVMSLMSVQVQFI